MRNAAFFLAIGLTACGASSDTRTDSGPPPADSGAGTDGGMAGFPVQHVRDDCAPDDGPALRLELYQSGAACMGDPAAPSLSLYLYESDTLFFPIEPGETVALAEGSATHCLGGTAPCRVASSGQVTFETFVDGVSASGTWSLTFQDDSTMSGVFDASWCDDDTRCG